MKSGNIIHIVGCHAEGEVGDVITAGVPPPPGTTVWEQSRWIAQDDRLRQLLLNEPRGGVFRHVNLLVPPQHPEADAASRFTGRIERETMVGDMAAIIPSVEGRAWRTGDRQVFVDPDDPWPLGYRVTDTWPA